MNKLFALLLLLSLSINAQDADGGGCRKMNDKAMVLYHTDPDGALQLLKKAEVIANEYQDSEMMSLTQSNLAILKRMKGEFLESKSMSVKALKGAKESLTKASIYNNMGACDRALGKYKESLASYLKALKIYETQRDIKGQATVNNNIGMVFSSLDVLDKAKIYHRKALKLSTSLKDKKRISESLNNLAIALASEDSLPQAMACFRKSLRIEESLRDQKGISESLNNVGSVHYYMEAIDSALYYFEKSAAIDLKMNNLSGASDGYNNIAQIYMETKKFDKAKEFIDKAYQHSLKAKAVETRLTSIDKYKTYYESTGNFAAANKKIQEYYALKDSVQEISKVRDINELETKYQTAKKEKLILQKEAENKKKTTWLIIVSLLSLFVGAVGLLIYKQQKLRNKQQEQEFQLKSAIAKIETQNKLQEQRLEISRDLHDNIGSQMTFIISSVDNIKYAFDLQNSKLDDKLSSISSFAKSTIIELRDTIWAMNKNEISFEDLQTRIHNFIDKAKEAREEVGFSFEIESEEKNIKFSSFEGMNIYRTIQEAVNNSIKYANASQISVKIIVAEEDKITIRIQDNGIGFNSDEVELGNGIANMKKRIADVRGTFKIKSEANKGTQITITLKKHIP